MKVRSLRAAGFFFLCAALLISSVLPLSAAHADTAIATGYVTSATLNMRTGPNVDNKIVETLALGDKVTVYAVSGTWLKVDAQNSGNSGYVSGKYITLNADSQGAYGLGVISGSVHLREKATAKSDSVDVLHAGEALTVLGADGTTGWYQVSLHGSSQKGYVSPKYVTVVTKFKKTETAASGSATISGSGVNLRKGPSKDDESLGKLSKNTAVTVLKTSGNWCQVKVTSTGKAGYVYKTYVKLSSGSSSSSTATTGTGYINGSNVNLRSGPSTNDASKAKLPKNTAVTVLKTTGKWHQVKVNASGSTGYVFASYVTMGSTSGGTPAPSAASGQAGYINATDVNLRTKASSTSQKMGKLAKNTPLTVLSKSGNWYQVTVPSLNKTGYVYKTYVTIASTVPTPTPTPKATPTPTPKPTPTPTPAGLGILTPGT